MIKCYFCKAIIQNIPYRCKYCGLLFCNKHRIPENHSCLFDLKIKFEKLIYEDALDFVEQKLTVAKIYEYVTKKELSKEEALKLLNFFIESSSNMDNRINSLTAFGLLNLNSKESFKVLENCLISDENHEVRRTAAKVLSKLFPKKSEALINYALNQKLI
ncbi:MAG: AN1-type zinc finger domain-containing protein [Candidatus Thorarchaeota archaeon]